MLNLQRRLANVERQTERLAEEMVIQADDETIAQDVPAGWIPRFKYGRSLLREGMAPDEVRAKLRYADIVFEAAPEIFWVVHITSVYGAEFRTPREGATDADVERLLELLGAGGQDPGAEIARQS